MVVPQSHHGSPGWAGRYAIVSQPVAAAMPKVRPIMVPAFHVDEPRIGEPQTRSTSHTVKAPKAEIAKTIKNARRTRRSVDFRCTLLKLAVVGALTQIMRVRTTTP
jgi:hypothetical protein